MSKVITNMAGNVWKVLVNIGDKVEEGQSVVILESMKMEIHVTADEPGIVKELKVNEGDFVDDGDIILELEY